MRVPVKLLGFGFWLFFFNCAQCQEIMCAAPNIPNAYIVRGWKPNYKISSRIEYKCNLGFEPKQPVQITCDNKGEWTEIQQCTEKMCAAPYIPNAYIVGGQRLNYKISSIIEYKCNPGFEPKQPVQITCDNRGEWTEIQQCTEKMCAAPNIPNAYIVRGQKPNYNISSIIDYKCYPGFEPEQPVQITCDNKGQWTEIQQCTAMCATPYIPNAEFVEGHRLNYRVNSTMEYKCSPGFEPEQPVQITCESKREWTGIQECTVPGICGPPPQVKDGDTIEIPKKEYNTGERVQYICFNKYILDNHPPFSNFFTCEQGKWIGNIKCLKPCTVTVGEMNERGIEFAYGDKDKLLVPHNDHLTFRCKSGKLNIDIEPRQQCKDGVMTLPKCV